MFILSSEIPFVLILESLKCARNRGMSKKCFEMINQNWMGNEKMELLDDGTCMVYAKLLQLCGKNGNCTYNRVQMY